MSENPIIQILENIEKNRIERVAYKTKMLKTASTELLHYMLDNQDSLLKEEVTLENKGIILEILKDRENANT